MIVKNLLRRKTRSLLTVFGIAVAVAAVIALGALADGLIKTYAGLSGGSRADLLVAQRDALDFLTSAVDERVEPTLAGLAGIRHVSKMIYTLAETDRVVYITVYGYEPAGFAIQHFRITEGESLSLGSEQHRRKTLLIGQAAAQVFDKGIGDTFRLNESIYRIVGIYETGQPFEDGAVVVLPEDAQAISGKPSQVNAFLLQLHQDANVARLRQRIEQRFPDVVVTTCSDFDQAQEFLQYVQAFTWGISFVAMVTGATGVMNTMMMSVLERTREFGVLRAVGWRSTRVLRMVLGESLLLSALGGGGGMVLGIMAARVVERIPTMSIVPSSFSVSLLAKGFAVALSLGLIGSALPAWRACRLLPIDAIRARSSSVGAPRHTQPVVLRNILRRPARTLLTIAGIGIAVMAIVLSEAMGNGLVSGISGLAGGTGAHLMGIKANTSVQLSKIDESVVRRISSQPGVQAAEGCLFRYTTVDDLPLFIAFGHRPRGRSVQSYQIVEGEPLTTHRQVILGHLASDHLSKQVGQTLHILGQAFRIVGIYETGIPVQDSGAVFSLRDMQNLFGLPRKVSFVNIWLDDVQQVNLTTQQIEEHIPEITLSQASNLAEDLMDLQMIRASTWGITLMALIVSGLGLTNTMMISVSERTHEVGILRALGWRTSRLLGMIVQESIILSLMGSAMGAAAGIAFGWLLNKVPVTRGLIRCEYDIELLAQVLQAAVTLGIFGSFYPAWRAARLPPVEALRYE